MFTLGMTAGEDKDLILVVRINLDTEYMYFSDTVDQITLSSIAFDGKVISKNSISEATKDVDVTSGGTIGQVGNWNLSLARYTTYVGSVTTFNDFFNDFAPATSKPVLTSKTVDVGVVWTGATTTNEITWLYQFYIETYDWTTYSLILGCIEYDELVATQLPYYVAQNEFDNGISYFTNAPEESYGQVIPIVYGDFSTQNLTYGTYSCVPCIKVDKGNYYKTSCHLFKEKFSSESLFDYIDTVGTIRRLYATGASDLNTRAGYHVSLGTYLLPVYGELIMQPKGYLLGGSDYENAVDDDSATYATLTPGQTMEWKIGVNLSGVGDFNGALNDTSLNVEWDASGGNVNYQVQHYHETLALYPSLLASGSSSGTGNIINYYFGAGNSGSPIAKYEDTAHWEVDELQVLIFEIRNLGTSVGTMRVKNLYFNFKNLTVFERYVLNMSGRQASIFDLQFQANFTNNAQYTEYGGRARIANIKLKTVVNTNVFASGKGMIYEYWVD